MGPFPEAPLPRAIAPLLLACLPLLLGLEARPAHANAEAYAKRLSIADPDDLYRAIEELAAQPDADAALPLLEAGIQAGWPHLAIACGEALAAIPAEALKAKVFGDSRVARDLDRLVDRAAKEADLDRQRNLARVLGAWGHPWVDDALASLASGRRKPEVQAEALFMCGRLPISESEPFPLTAAAVIKALGGRNEEIQCAACSAAGLRRMNDAEPALVSLVKRSTGEYPGLYAVWALKQIGYRGGIGSFLHVLEKGSPKRTTTQANLKAVTELCSERDVETLLAFTRSPRKDYRDAAALALGRLAWRAARQGRPAPGEPDPAAETTPREEGDPAPAADPPGGAAPRFSDRVVQRMIDLVRDDGTWEVRDAARQALLRFGERAKPKVLEQLPGLVEATSTDVQLTAIELCGLFGAADAYRPLLKIALYDKDRTKRMFAARALEGVDAPRAVEDLAQVARPRRQPKTEDLNAVRALGYLRVQPAYEALLKLIQEAEAHSEPVLREAEFALERLTGHRFGRKPDRWKAWRETAERPFHPRVKDFNRQQNRRDVIEKRLYGLTPVTEKAVENGLRWLELQQHPMGYWDGNEKGFGGVISCEPAYTGLSLLALLGAGYQGARGKYHETIRRATEFLAATQLYDGGFPISGGGDDSWIFAYLTGMGVWGVTEACGLSGDALYAEPAQWGVDYLIRVQTPGSGWRYSARMVQSDTSCTSWVLMTTKMADLIGLEVAQKSWDGIDSWLERCAYDITGEEEVPDDLKTDYDHEVGARRYFKAFTGYFELSGSEQSAAQQTSMTAVAMVCRFFMGWRRSHPFMIGSANYLMDYLPRWMSGLEKGQAIAWYHYFWYYGTLAMHQMGGRYWKAWNEKIRTMYPENQRTSPPHLAGSWDPDSALLNGGRLFSTAMSILALESYYRFSPLFE